MHELWKWFVVDHLGGLLSISTSLKICSCCPEYWGWIINFGSNWIAWLFLSGCDKTMVFLSFGSVSGDLVSGWYKAASTYFLFSMDEIIFGSIQMFLRLDIDGSWWCKCCEDSWTAVLSSLKYLALDSMFSQWWFEVLGIVLIVVGIVFHYSLKVLSSSNVS